MGARISIQFKNEKRLSPVLFSHWGGQQFYYDAKLYTKNLIKKSQSTEKSEPLYRLEPGTVMVDFIRHITRNYEKVTHDLYLEKSENDGDNSDYGHKIIDLNQIPDLLDK